MPELPDITAYAEALDARIVGEVLRDVRLQTPFLLRTVDPPLSAICDKGVMAVRRVGKRIVIALEDELFVVIHFMVARRWHWRSTGAKTKGCADLAAFDFDAGTLTLTEAGTTRRASLHVRCSWNGRSDYASRRRVSSPRR